MWLFFDNKGKLIKSLEHGSPARVGTTNFQICAYFDGINIDDNGRFPRATIKITPNHLYDSNYAFEMEKETKTFFQYQNEKDVCPFVDRREYKVFVIDFNDYYLEEEETYLNYPGLWKATITLNGTTTSFNVQGQFTFNVEE